MAELLRGAGLVVVGNLNLDLNKASGQGQYEEIVVVVAMAGLEYLAGHLLPQRRASFKDRRTWEVARQGRVVRSQSE